MSIILNMSAAVDFIGLSLSIAIPSFSNFWREVGAITNLVSFTTISAISIVHCICFSFLCSHGAKIIDIAAFFNIVYKL